MKTQNEQIDLRDEIEHHCLSCTKLNSSLCSGCFFSGVDFTDKLLGGMAVYSRAFKYLKTYRVKGFKRSRPFGSFLNITLGKDK